MPMSIDISQFCFLLQQKASYMGQEQTKKDGCGLKGG